MAPGYRTNTQTRRGARAGYPEHDDFEGLPVRQWRKQWVNVAPPPEIEENKKKDRWAEELPHGMPKDSDLLPTHSLALLRAARSGRLRKRPTPADDEDGDVDALLGDKTDKKASAMDEGFQVLMWKQVPRSEEGPTISHLAKRQKGTITLPSMAFATQTAGPTVTKATVRRIDAAGNPYTQEVTVTDGQQVDGEVISTSVVPAPEQGGQAPPAAATPTRRKPPIPQKKKGRGRGRGGRGRGRGLPLQASSRPGLQDGSGIDGAAGIKIEGMGPDGIKNEGEDGKAGQDVDMRDSSAVDEDGDEGEGDGEGEDGEDDDGDESGTPADNEDQDMDDAPALADATFTSTTAANASEATSSLATPTPNLLNTDTPRIEGSPLKNVLTRSPTNASAHIAPMTIPTNTDVGSSGAPDDSTVGLQPSSVTSQSQQGLEAEATDETSTEEAKPTEATTSDTSAEKTAGAEPVALEVAAPETTAPETTVPETTASETTVPDTTVPDAAVPETTAPETTVPDTTMPDAAVPEVAVLEAAVPETDVPETAVREAVAPEATVPGATEPEATEPEVTEPEAAEPEAAEPEAAEPEAAEPEAAEPEAADPEAAVPVPEKTTDLVAIDSTQDLEESAVPSPDPPVMSPAIVEQPPPAEDASPPVEASTADIPIPTSEDPKTGEAPETDAAAVKPEAPLAGTETAQPPVTGRAPDTAPVAKAPMTRIITEDGTDDGLDLLGPLGASLSRQAEEDVPAPTSDPANPQTEGADETETQKEEAVPQGNAGGD